jgi:hypothetical protein
MRRGAQGRVAEPDYETAPLLQSTHGARQSAMPRMRTMLGTVDYSSHPWSHPPSPAAAGDLGVPVCSFTVPVCPELGSVRTLVVAVCCAPAGKVFRAPSTVPFLSGGCPCVRRRLDVAVARGVLRNCMTVPDSSPVPSRVPRRGLVVTCVPKVPIWKQYISMCCSWIR